MKKCVKNETSPEHFESSSQVSKNYSRPKIFQATATCESFFLEHQLNTILDLHGSIFTVDEPDFSSEQDFSEFKLHLDLYPHTKVQNIVSRLLQQVPYFQNFKVECLPDIRLQLSKLIQYDIIIKMPKKDFPYVSQDSKEDKLCVFCDTPKSAENSSNFKWMVCRHLRMIKLKSNSIDGGIICLDDQFFDIIYQSVNEDQPEKPSIPAPQPSIWSWPDFDVKISDIPFESWTASVKSSPSQRFNCLICFKMFHNYFTLKQHFETHANGKSQSCLECGKIFTRPSHLVRHFYTQNHSNYSVKQKVPAKLECRYCKKYFNRKSYLKKHEYTHFPGNSGNIWGKSSNSVLKVCHNDFFY